MKYQLKLNSCRVCLRKCKKLRSIYEPLNVGSTPPNEMLRLTTGIIISVQDDDELPKNICKNCELSLNLAFKFRSKALKSHEILELIYNRRRFGHDGVQKLSIEVDQFVKPEIKVIDEMLSPNEFVEAICTKETEGITMEMKVEDLETPFSEEDKLTYIEPEASVCEIDTIDHNESLINSLSEEESSIIIDKHDFKVDELEPISNECKHRNASWGKPIYDTTEKKRRKNQHALPKFNILTNKHSKSRVDDENSHICDICGNIYAKRGRLMEHRRRHDPELRFACELCDKRFQLREKLRKHMFSHGGQKPYHCSFCSRTFIYESVKKAHEAVHKGVKPYVCEVCKKAFAYSHALKKHKLIHADIKLYHCVFCNKDFRLQHHMKQHEETKLHQNAVKQRQETISTSTLWNS